MDPTPTTTPVADRRISVLCVDDNQHVAQAVDITLRRAGRFEWKGWLPCADDVVTVVRRDLPSIVLLDVDMPGRNPFEASAELLDQYPESRVVFFSAHCDRNLVDQAVEAGAWGYASKDDGCDALLDVIERVGAGEVAFSPSVRGSYGR
jgi:two-component system, NarL family, response regulator DegU